MQAFFLRCGLAQKMGMPTLFPTTFRLLSSPHIPTSSGTRNFAACILPPSPKRRREQNHLQILKYRYVTSASRVTRAWARQVFDREARGSTFLSRDYSGWKLSAGGKAAALYNRGHRRVSEGDTRWGWKRRGDGSLVTTPETVDIAREPVQINKPVRRARTKNGVRGSGGRVAPGYGNH